MKLRALATTDTESFTQSSDFISAASQDIGFILVENQVFKSPKP